MDLPILTIAPTASPTDLVRFYHKLVHDYYLPLAESELLDNGVAFYSPALATIDEANRMIDASVPPGADVNASIESVNVFFRRHGTSCRAWVLNPSHDERAMRPLVDALQAHGYQRRAHAIRHAMRLVRDARPETPGLQILPARAAYRLVRELTEERTAGDAQRSEALMLHLDEPRYEAQIALRDNVAVGIVGVLTVGDMGLIADLYVAPHVRRMGIGRTLLGRAVEHCIRSTFKHVFAGIAHDDTIGSGMLARCGFEPAGEYVQFVAQM